MLLFKFAFLREYQEAVNGKVHGLFFAFSRNDKDVMTDASEETMSVRFFKRNEKITDRKSSTTHPLQLMTPTKEKTNSG